MVEENVISNQECDDITSLCLDYLNQTERPISEPKGIGDGQDTFQSRLERHDYQVFMPSASNLINPVYNKIVPKVIEKVEAYRSVIGSVQNYRLYCPTIKFQWTPIGGGFSPWHIEHAGGNSSVRVLAWMIYLNDVTDGGDTEFVYQHRKIQPKQGSFAMWPAGLTHPHRGNPPYSNDKYVLTGWINCAPDDEIAMCMEYAYQNLRG